VYVSNYHGVNLVHENSDAGHIKSSIAGRSIPILAFESVSSSDSKSTWL